jgi:hypothetical protein
VIGRYCYDLSLHCEESCQRDEAACLAAKVWRTGQAVREVCLSGNGACKEIHVDLAASPMFDSQGRLMRVVSVCRDVTVERRS